jgi:hypothetical protein
VKAPLLGGIILVTLTLPSAALEFGKDVLPILESNCFKCHKDGKEKGDLNLQPYKIKQHIGSGRQIVPGKPSSGLFMKMIQSEDPDNRMPPKGSRLSEEEVQTLKLWIAQGAELGDHDPDPVPGAPKPLEGVWTNKAGKEIKATLLRVEGDKAVLKLTSGKIYKYAISNLSAESQSKVKEFAKQGKR